MKNISMIIVVYVIYVNMCILSKMHASSKSLRESLHESMNDHVH